MPRPVQIDEFVSRAIDERLKTVFTALIAKVVSYDSAKLTAQVQPVVAVDDGTGGAEPYPIISDVRVVWPSGGGFFFHAPLAAGDFVLCLCPHQNHGDWLEMGAEGSVPTDAERHGLSVLFAMPCTYPVGGEIAPGSANITFGETGGFTVTVTNSAMEVGGSSDSAALASKVDELLSAYNTHTHTGVTAGMAVSGTTAAVVTGSSASSDLKVGG